MVKETERKVRFMVHKAITTEQLSDYLNVTDIPVQLNGRYNKPLNVVPNSVRPAKLHNTFTDEQIKNIYQTFDFIVNEN